MERHLRADHPVLEAGRPRLGKRLAPYLLTAPGALWLLIFFLIPMGAMLVLALETRIPTSGFLNVGYRFSWHVAQFGEAFRLYHTQLFRSLNYASIVTVLTLLIGYPVAYWIAFYGGRRKTTYLFLLLLPFFVSQFILSDEGIVIRNLERWHLVPSGFHILSTSTAVIAGITYNALPFMILPLYVSLEKIDRSVVEAAKDLYANKRDVFLKVILPLSVPGIFAGFLLTFVPAVGDYVNAEILGGTGTTMIGNVIQFEFLTANDYPMASALSFILMVGLLIGILIYGRVLGTRQIEEYV